MYFLLTISAMPTYRPGREEARDKRKKKGRKTTDKAPSGRVVGTSLRNSARTVKRHQDPRPPPVPKRSASVTFKETSV